MRNYFTFTKTVAQLLFFSAVTQSKGISKCWIPLNSLAAAEAFCEEHVWSRAVMWREHRPVKGAGAERASTDQNHTETGWVSHTEPSDTQSQPHVGDRAGHKQKSNTSPFLSPFTTDVEGFSWFSVHPGISCDPTLLSLPPTSAEVLCRSWCSSVLTLLWAGHGSPASVEVQPLSLLRKLWIPGPSAGSGWAPALLWLSAAGHWPGAGGDGAGAASNTSCSSCCLETCTGKHSASTLHGANNLKTCLPAHALFWVRKYRQC